MDYWNGTTNATIGLAVVRKPARVPVSHSQYGGAVLLNPGGPGGSGIGLLVGGGDAIRSKIDTIKAGDGKYFDLISFDPRGVGLTQPPVQCITNPALAHTWQVRLMEEGVYEASDAAIGRLWSMNEALSASCSLPLPRGVPDIREYVSTASVARDMLEITERHGQWREEEAKRLVLGMSCGKHKQATAQESLRGIAERTRYRAGTELIQYWGFSYGSYLGNTFAAMFPDRVGRLIVDGVVDAYNYKRTLWSDNLLDTELDWNQFSYHCARVGFPTCLLANETGETTAEGVRDRVLNITQSLYHNPLPVIGPKPEVITYSDVKGLIFAALYTPIQAFPYVAYLLAGVEQGNGTEFARLLSIYHDFQCPKEEALMQNIIPLRNKSSGPSGPDATRAIACSDGDDQSWVNRTVFDKYVKELNKSSPTLGSLWSGLRLACIHYSVRAHHRFEGPWKAKTAHPLLLIGNTADPVTPVKHAINMAKGFEGAVALTQDSAGHCSLSTFSNCTVHHVRQYFQTGILPPPNTTCTADEVPFGPEPGELSTDSLETLEAKKQHEVLATVLYRSGMSRARVPIVEDVAWPWQG
ncbi:hypothetical protein LTR86_007980 [Recurvomyces mirabilis]|nr:hypothetical protein LTR86_007980 [Recurvomyces mirabilis]